MKIKYWMRAILLLLVAGWSPLLAQQQIQGTVVDSQQNHWQA